ncbi:extracellular solute-binding protein [Mesorhizobium sp. M0984]|uniref:extracellular solute-binding protein n=1 Tax=unclassified Mesorhizobium TaxID=325217 RepID=UPI00333D1260
MLLLAMGGSYDQKVREFVFEPFTQDNGIYVNFISGSTSEVWAKVKAMSGLGNVEWDMMETGTGDVFVSELQALLYDLGNDCAKVPRAKSDGVADVQQIWRSASLGATLLVANEQIFGGKFFDIQDFPGPRALPDFSTPWRVLIGALLADGVDRDKLFPLDLDRAFRKLDEMHPNISMWWKSGDRDAPHRENALRFLNWYFDHPEVQAAFAKSISAAPTTKSALALLPPEEQKDSPIKPDNLRGMVNVDYIWLGAHNKQSTERWMNWIAQ